MKRTICSILFLILLAADIAGAATRYTMRNLGTLPGDDASQAEAINNKGQVIGTSWRSADSPDPILAKCRSFLWENGRLAEVKAPVGEKGVCRTDINDLGVCMIAGWDESFTLDKGAATKIPPLPGRKSIRALHINNRGEVLANGAGKSGPMELVVHRAGVSKVIKMPEGYTRVDSAAINHKGQVALTIQKADGRCATAVWEDGKMRFLSGVPEGLEVCAFSDDGAIAGIYDNGEEAKGCVWRNGAVTYLRSPKGLYDAWPASINKNGEVVGLCLSEEAATYAVYWDRNGAATELTTEDLYQCEAVDINDAGVIVGMMFDDNGRSRAVMWTPVK